MIDLSKRSYQKELLDADDLPFADVRQNMKELDTINTWLGGHKITIHAVKKLGQINKQLCICEIGCGGGDNLKAIDRWAKKKNKGVSYIGIDIKKACIDFAQQQYPALNAQWIESDYQKVNFENNKPDIIFSSLFCHHFNENELVSMMQWMQKNCRLGFFINDLERNTIAYYSIKLLTRLFSKSYLVKHDAPLSVARGFKKKEWKSIFQKATIRSYCIQWKWAFRHLILYKKDA